MKEKDRSYPGVQHAVLHNRVKCHTVLLLLLLLTGMVTSCGTPSPAPVLSREKSSPTTQQLPLSPRQRLRRRPAYYRVRRGDTLISIAWRFGLDYRVLAGWNRLAKPYTIYPGDRLVLVKPKRVVAPEHVTRKPAAEANKKRIKNEQSAVPGSQTKRGTSAKHAIQPPSSSQKKGDLKWQWPARGSISQGYIRGDPTRKGIVIAGRLGQSVVAAESGRVVYAGSGLIGYGLLIIIKHNNKYLSAYGYNRKIKVREGDQITKGDAIAEMGAKGNTNAVLHFEIRHNGLPVDPLKVLPP